MTPLAHTCDQLGPGVKDRHALFYTFNCASKVTTVFNFRNICTKCGFHFVKAISDFRKSSDNCDVRTSNVLSQFVLAFSVNQRQSAENQLGNKFIVHIFRFRPSTLVCFCLHAKGYFFLRRSHELFQILLFSRPNQCLVDKIVSAISLNTGLT